MWQVAPTKIQLVLQIQTSFNQIGGKPGAANIKYTFVTCQLQQ